MITAWFFLPLIGWVLWKRKPAPRPNFSVHFLATLIVGSLLYIGGVWLYGFELERELYGFDVNGDREFSASELAAGGQEAMRRLTKDTGRTFAPIVAAPATLVWCSFWFLVFQTGAWLRNKSEGGVARDGMDR